MRRVPGSGAQHHDQRLPRRAVHVGDVVHVDARITWAGCVSMEVAVQISADRWDRAVPPGDVATAHPVMAAVDDHGDPRAVPPLLPQTDGTATRHQYRARTAHYQRRRRLHQVRLECLAEAVHHDRWPQLIDRPNS
ncbi:hypothetical protein [Micromonospora sp. RP3T]|uniref:hypothetical protein n=1 Tax=Micromonospora sp. RP3T TaxID=2135446 RepID=UPI001E445742|nr:hypothetical protein [Micromonospora sp. RP3T]